MPDPNASVITPPRERRHTPRYAFLAATEVIDAVSSLKLLNAAVVNLSRYGCFLQTKIPFPQGTQVRLKIIYAGRTFDGLGRVAYVIDTGMGIVYTQVEADQQALLDGWLEALREKAESQRLNEKRSEGLGFQVANLLPG